MEAVGYFEKQSRFANKMKSKYYQLKKFADDFEKVRNGKFIFCTIMLI